MEENTDKSTEEVMNCLLSLSKISNVEHDYQYWSNYQEGDATSTIVWKFEPEENLVQVPISYKVVPSIPSATTTTAPPAEVTESSNVVLLQAPQYYVGPPVYNNEVVVTNQVEPTSFNNESSYEESVEVDVEDSDGQEQYFNVAEQLIASAGLNKIKKTPPVTRKKRVRGKKTAKKTVSPDKKLQKLALQANRMGAGKKVNNAPGGYNELTDLEENAEQVAQRFRLGCECASNNCFDGFNAEKVYRHRLNIADLTKAEHDMYLMGVIHVATLNPEETSRRKERLRMRTTYAYHGKKVCLTAFLYLEHVTLYQMKRLRKHLQNHGVTPRTHGNYGRKPSNTLPLDIYQHAMSFVQKFLDENQSKSSETSKTKTSPAKFPADITKKTLHKEYVKFCQVSAPFDKVMQYSTFTTFIKKQFPMVRFKKCDKFVSKCEDVYHGRKRGSKKMAASQTVSSMDRLEMGDVEVVDELNDEDQFVIVDGDSQVVVDEYGTVILPN